MPVEEIAANLKGLRARLGVYAVLGNHDGWHDVAAIAATLNANDIRVLDGAVAVEERNGATLRILGLKDQLKIESWEDFNEDARKLLSATEGAGDILILEHSPDVAPIINGPEPVSKDMRLMIAAHTHGGQVWLPVLGRPIVPSSYGQKFAAGHVRENGLDMFVTTGVGTSILPFRFMVPPEIAVITVRSAN
jgi:predicted MPP superfamily phosphohydrolase